MLGGQFVIICAGSPCTLVEITIPQLSARTMLAPRMSQRVCEQLVLGCAACFANCVCSYWACEIRFVLLLVWMVAETNKLEAVRNHAFDSLAFEPEMGGPGASIAQGGHGRRSRRPECRAGA